MAQLLRMRWHRVPARGDCAERSAQRAIAFEFFDWDIYDSVYAIIVAWRLKL